MGETVGPGSLDSSRLLLPKQLLRYSQQPIAASPHERYGATPPLKPAGRSATTGDSLQSSKYRPPIPSSKEEATSSTEVAAPCGTVLRKKNLRPIEAVMGALPVMSRLAGAERRLRFRPPFRAPRTDPSVRS